MEVILLVQQANASNRQALAGSIGFEQAQRG
jgi:hypothetical protein